MNPVMRGAMRTGNRVGVRLYRWSGGRIGGRGADKVPVLLITVPGRRSGRRRTTPVGYFEEGGGYLVVGSGGGMAQDPDWFKNLRATPRADVEIGSRSFTTDVTELTGEERDLAFTDVVLARSPRFAKYETKSGRRMPVARLTPMA